MNSDTKRARTKIRCLAKDDGKEEPGPEQIMSGRSSYFTASFSQQEYELEGLSSVHKSRSWKTQKAGSTGSLCALFCNQGQSEQAGKSEAGMK